MHLLYETVERVTCRACSTLFSLCVHTHLHYGSDVREGGVGGVVEEEELDYDESMEGLDLYPTGSLEVEESEGGVGMRLCKQHMCMEWRSKPPTHTLQVYYYMQGN